MEMGSTAQDLKSIGKQRKGRGSVNNKRRLEEVFGGKGTGGADWGNARAEWVLSVVVAASQLGGAVTFGLSRDGGAHMLAIMLDGERATLWFNGDADLDLELEKVFVQLDTMKG